MFCSTLWVECEPVDLIMTKCPKTCLHDIILCNIILPRLLFFICVNKLHTNAACLPSGFVYAPSNFRSTLNVSQCFVQAVCYWTALGYRVQGLITGRVLAESKQDFTKISLQNIKEHTYGMRMLGFAVVSNPLRNDSAAAINELQDRYSSQPMASSNSGFDCQVGDQACLTFSFKPYSRHTQHLKQWVFAYGKSLLTIEQAVRHDLLGLLHLLLKTLRLELWKEPN